MDSVLKNSYARGKDRYKNLIMNKEVIKLLIFIIKNIAQVNAWYRIYKDEIILLAGCLQHSCPFDHAPTQK